MADSKDNTTYTVWEIAYSGRCQPRQCVRETEHYAWLVPKHDWGCDTDKRQGTQVKKHRTIYPSFERCKEELIRRATRELLRSRDDLQRAEKRLREVMDLEEGDL